MLIAAVKYCQNNINGRRAQRTKDVHVRRCWVCNNIGFCSTTNNLPVANCRPDFAVAIGETFDINDGSDDPDVILSGDFITLTQSVDIFTDVADVGVHQVQLVVRDLFGEASECSTSVTVNPP